MNLKKLIPDPTSQHVTAFWLVESTKTVVTPAVNVPTAAVVAFIEEMDTVLNESSLFCFVLNPATRELTVARTSKASFNPAVFAMVSDPSAMDGVDTRLSTSVFVYTFGHVRFPPSASVVDM